MTVAVGVYATTEAHRLRATLSSLRRPLGIPVEPFLLLDGPEPAVLGVAAEHPELRVLTSEVPAGAPAFFNRLLRSTTHAVAVFLEAGSVGGGDWLPRLVNALEADPRNGLAGPSTNLAWNEQRVFPHAHGSEEDVSVRAAEAARRFGAECRTLEPLHSLGDFCYAAHRRLFDAIGEADEGYGLGPCWEMDYNVRAARAGFRAVWVPGAYVWRPAFSGRRAAAESRFFTQSRHRYQDKFCGLRLRQERAGYESHCRGEACEHFAPSDLIEITRRPAAASAAEAPAPPPVRSLPPEPLVSCIMPTSGRRDFILQAIRYAQRQTVTDWELVIVDDGPVDLMPHLGADPRVRYLRVVSGQSIGAKRNHAVAQARGRFVIHWDDDDWYGSKRLETQLAPLLAGEAKLSGLRTGVVFSVPDWRFWRLSQSLHRRLFVHDVHGGTICYARSVWLEGTRYPPLSLGEDAHFLASAVRRGNRLVQLDGEGHFIYIRHQSITWRLACGQTGDPSGWEPATQPSELAFDCDFYATMSAAPAAERPPAVSCIMPTANRPHLVPRAIQFFLAQRYPVAELVIIDDGTESIAPLIPIDSRIRYQRLPERVRLGAKRNIACEMSRGDVILHWDDDDWAAPHRVQTQVAALLGHPGVDLAGQSEVTFYSPTDRRSWRYRYGHSRQPWVAGSTFCYHRRLWQRHAFPAIDDGEDTRFVWSLRPEQVTAFADQGIHVGIIHDRNASAKRIVDPWWTALDSEPIRLRLGDDLPFYDALGDSLRARRSA
ncbi:MAG TPA: glycosyltransferase [Gemmatimonadales bacterium]|nr:glycosyltransferase [Gemmatimonadales bacterium]